MTGRFSNFNSISYTEGQHELRVAGTKCRRPDTMSGTGKIFIPGAGREVISFTGTPYEKTSKELIPILRESQGRSVLYIKNSRELEEKLKNGE